MKITTVALAALFAFSVAGTAMAGSCCPSKAAAAAPAAAKCEGKKEDCGAAKTCSKDKESTTVASLTVKK